MSEEIVFKEGVHKIGKPCGKCGSCIRYVSSRACISCLNEQTKQLKENREASYEGTHYEGDACIKCGNFIRYVRTGKCVECDKKRGKRRRQNLKEIHSDLFFEGHPCIKCGGCIRYTNGGECVKCVKERDKRYATNNPEVIRSLARRRRARKQNAEGSFTIPEWLDLCSQHGNICLCCKEEKPLEADHVVPLSQGGTDYIDNIQPLCKSCNSKKGTKTIDYRPDHQTESS